MDCSIFITRSNSKMLTSKIYYLLTGRIIEFTTYPFLYDESIKFREINSIDIVKNSFYDYLKLDRYPFRFSSNMEQD